MSEHTHSAGHSGPAHQQNEKPADQVNSKPKEYIIIVSGREKTVTDHKLTYWQVVELYLNGVTPDPKFTYTVTYRKGNNDNHEGSMVDGDIVTIKDGMVFNVSATIKS